MNESPSPASSPYRIPHSRAFLRRSADIALIALLGLVILLAGLIGLSPNPLHMFAAVCGGMMLLALIVISLLGHAFRDVYRKEQEAHRHPGE